MIRFCHLKFVSSDHWNLSGVSPNLPWHTNLQGGGSLKMPLPDSPTPRDSDSAGLGRGPEADF